MTRLLATLAVAVLGTPAAAALTQVELEAVGLRPDEHAAVPPDLGLMDGTNPAVLVFADFSCPDICDPLVAQTAQSLAGTRLVAGEDYRLIVVGMDPRDAPGTRDAFLEGAIGSARASTFVPDLTGGQIARLADALGFGYVLDVERNRFAHPVGSYLLTPGGRLSRVFPTLFVDPADMRRALVEAGGGTVGRFVERIALTCYGFDALTGRYSLAIERVLMIVSLLFAAAFGAALAWAHLRDRHREGTR